MKPCRRAFPNAVWVPFPRLRRAGDDTENAPVSSPAERSSGKGTQAFQTPISHRFLPRQSEAIQLFLRKKAGLLRRWRSSQWRRCLRCPSGGNGERSV